MKISELIEKTGWRVLSGADLQREVQCVYTCDLLSVVMGKAPSSCAWVTVMSNINSVAVAALADISVIVLAGGASPDEAAVEKARLEGINMLLSDKPIFETALEIHGLLA
ncbi:MAG: hypothetical protein ACI4JX_04225 [Oscillospiraceae bacterium]